MVSSIPRKDEIARLERLVLLLRAADEAHRGHAVTVAAERLPSRPRAMRGCRRGRDNCSLEIQDIVAAHVNLRRLRERDDALGLVQPIAFRLASSIDKGKASAIGRLTAAQSSRAREERSKYIAVLWIIYRS